MEKESTIPINEQQKDNLNHKEKQEISENVLHFIEKIYNNFVKYFSPIFTFSLINLVLFSFLLINKFLLHYWYINYGFITYVILNALFICQVFYVISNYILSCIIKPGTLEDLRNSKYFKKHNPYITKVISFQHLPKSKEKYEFDFCTICNEIKPLRSHHCSVCKQCILKMDHHCPWINNCIGLHNQRYFVCFLTHLCFFCLHVIVLSSPLMYQYMTNQAKNFQEEILFITIVSTAGFFIALFFSVWNWALVIRGYTAIEFWQKKKGLLKLKDDSSKEEQIYNFSSGKVREHLFEIFGDTNILSILFCIKRKKLPYAGIELSRYYDGAFTVKGIEEIKEE